MANKSRATLAKRTKDQLISEFIELQDSVKNAPAQDPTSAAQARDNVTKTREAVKAVSVDNIVSSGASFGLSVQRTVAGLTEQAVQKAEELKQLQDAVEIETAELERLYGLDVVLASTRALIEEHEAKKAALEKEIATARAAWQEEVATHNKTIVARNNDIETKRVREQAEYEYKTRQERERATEEFSYAMKQQERAQVERMQTAQKEINLRMNELSTQSEALNSERARIAGIDDEIKAAVDKAVAIATNSLKRDLEGKFAVERMELNTNIRLAQQQNASSEGTVTRLTGEIVKLQAQLDAARSEVRDIAKSAVEGASGQMALTKVMEMRQESNGTTPRKS